MGFLGMNFHHLRFFVLEHVPWIDPKMDLIRIYNYRSINRMDLKERSNEKDIRV